MKPTEHKTTVRMPRSLHKAARMRALEEDTTLSDVIRELVRLWLDNKIELLAEEKQPKEE